MPSIFKDTYQKYPIIQKWTLGHFWSILLFLSILLKIWQNWQFLQFSQNWKNCTKWPFLQKMGILRKTDPKWVLAFLGQKPRFGTFFLRKMSKKRSRRGRFDVPYFRGVVVSDLSIALFLENPRRVRRKTSCGQSRPDFATFYVIEVRFSGGIWPQQKVKKAII